MSYEGHIQYWCGKGHYWESDCYAAERICPYCKTDAVFDNDVDDTNGQSFGYITPILISPDIPGVSDTKLAEAAKVFKEIVQHELTAREMKGLHDVLLTFAPITAEHAVYAIPNSATKRQFCDDDGVWKDCG